LHTFELVREVFEKQGKTEKGESLLEEMMRLVQKGEPAPVVSQPTPMRRTSQQRRTSRMLSISLAVPRIDFSADGPPISTVQVLQSLPSAQILLRHLPTTITGFTPFIAPSTTPVLEDKLGEWQRSSIQLLREAVPGWLAGLHSIASVWQVRKVVVAVLDGDGLFADIRCALEDEWGARVREVWADKLDKLVEVAEAQIREAGEDIRQNGGELGKSPLGSLLASC
jgi:hypothetical protein